MTRILGWLQRHPRIKAFCRALLSAFIFVLPAKLAYRVRACVENMVFNSTPQIGELPPIFHYWSSHYLQPALREQGFESPDDFFFQEILRRVQHAAAHHRAIACASIAAGRCETEIEIARRLRALGFSNFGWVALDINSRLLDDAARSAEKAGVADLMDFEIFDLNAAKPFASFDVVIANQCLHHFDNLECALDFVHDSLRKDGVLLTSDVIGRNGHMLWPEALAEVEAIWEGMPDRYRQDRALGQISQRYVNYNHANVGFEGIRAQDILSVLMARFSFSRFIGFGCIIFPFIERRFGWNFDPENAQDREFIDRVAARDQALLLEGRLKPTQLLASLHRRGGQPPTTPDALAFQSWRDPVRP